MLAMPLCAAAADVDVQARQAGNQVVGNQDVRDNVQRTRNDVRDMRNEAAKRDAVLTQDERNKVTMDRIEQKEDKQSVGEYLDDAGVTAKVKSKFIGQKGLDSLDIKVVTVDGTVTLMGDVDNPAQIGLAESVAKDVDGVRNVNNKLVVKK